MQVTGRAKRAKLYAFKAKYISKLALHCTRSEAERELCQMLISKLARLRAMNLPSLAHTLYTIINKENVSPELRELCSQMLSEINTLEQE